MPAETVVRRGAAVAVAALVLWGAWGFAAELAYRLDPTPPRRGGVVAWNPGDPGPESLRALLEAFAPRLPDGAAVVVTGGEERAAEDFFIALWGAYYLPRHRVVPVRHPGAAYAADFWIGWECELEDPAITEVARHPRGVLYRVRPPA